MKQLVFIRHAKSDRTANITEDLFRPLNQRGYDDATLMAEKIFSYNCLPDLIYVSPSIRTYSTAVIFCNKLKIPVHKLVVSDRLYMASAQTICRVLEKTENALSVVWVVAHNPGITDVINTFSDLNIDNAPTCSITGIKVESDDWRNAIKSKKEVVFFQTPKMFKL